MSRSSEGSNAAWFIAGLAVGVAGAILFAPRSGRETRESIAGAASRGREFADRKRGDVAEFSRSVVDQGREFASAARDAIDKGRERLSDLSASRPKETPEAN